jgi:NTE family protein
VSRAVAASSAVPVLFSSITINNYAGTCNYQLLPWIQQALNDPDATSRRHHLAKKYAQWLDRDTYPYLHLYDGGLTDNLGIRPLMNRIAILGDAWKLGKLTGRADLKRVLTIVVNAQADSKIQFSKLARPVPLMDAILGASSIPLNEYTYESLLALHTEMKVFSDSYIKGRCADLASSGQETTGCDDFKTYLVVVDLDQIREKEKRERLKLLPTSFVLNPEDVDELKQVAKELLLQSKEFQRFLADLKK